MKTTCEYSMFSIFYLLFMAVPKRLCFSLKRWMDETFGSPMVHHGDTIHIEKHESEVFKALEKQTGAVCCPEKVPK